VYNVSILVIQAIPVLLNRPLHIWIAFFSLIVIPSLWSQTGNTVGLILNTENSYNGYTMLAPINSNSTYLLDNCGYVVNSWESDYGPALAAHLTTKGTMIRSGRITSDFLAGGSGGLIQEFDWDGNILWEVMLSNGLYHQHHDIKPMPNGNILVLAWEWNSSFDAMMLGRDPEKITDNGIWTEMLLEIEPVGVSDYLVKWEWHLNDHLVQDIDTSVANYGVISEHPELIDINYSNSLVDLFHANALDYNEERDQIVINFRNYHEFYVIDHSTTSAEAAGHTGGQMGRGGDVIYRFGNPAAYGRGEESDQKFYSQHGANWVDDGIYRNSIIVFNNGLERPQGSFSSVEIVTPPWNGSEYTLESNAAYGPEEFAFAYVGTPTSDFFSGRISNATVLPNDNVLICNGQLGQLFEVNQDKEKVWEYINPVLGPFISEQGEVNPESTVFSTERYSLDFPGIPESVNLGNPIEQFSDYECTITLEEVNVVDRGLDDVKLYANPVDEIIQIRNPLFYNLDCSVYDLYGRQVIPTFTSNEMNIQISNNLRSGYYLLKVSNKKLNAENIFKMIKR